MDRARQEITIKKLYRMYRKNMLNFDLLIQRKGGIWNRNKKALLVDTILIDSEIPPIYAIRNKDKNFTILDGKQRLTSLFDFIDSSFKMPKTIKTNTSVPKVISEEISNKKFKEFPTEIKNKILNYKLEIKYTTNSDENEIKDLFYRLNNGTPLKSIELIRVTIPTDVLKFTESIAETPFFQKIKFSPMQRRRNFDKKVILNCLMLIENYNSGLGDKDVAAYARTLTDKSLKDTLKAKMENTCHYLNEVFINSDKLLTKITVPLMFKMAYMIQDKKLAITHEEFLDWATKFFTTPPIEYKETLNKGTSLKANVQKRIEIVENDFTLTFNRKF